MIRRHVILKALYGLWPMFIYAVVMTAVIVYCWTIGRMPTWTLVVYVIVMLALGEMILVDECYRITGKQRKIKPGKH